MSRDYLGIFSKLILVLAKDEKSSLRNMTTDDDTALAKVIAFRDQVVAECEKEFGPLINELGDLEAQTKFDSLTPEKAKAAHLYKRWKIEQRIDKLTEWRGENPLEFMHSGRLDLVSPDLVNSREFDCKVLEAMAVHDVARAGFAKRRKQRQEAMEQGKLESQSESESEPEEEANAAQVRPLDHLQHLRHLQPAAWGPPPGLTATPGINEGLPYDDEAISHLPNKPKLATELAARKKAATAYTDEYLHQKVKENLTTKAANKRAGEVMESGVNKQPRTEEEEDDDYDPSVAFTGRARSSSSVEIIDDYVPEIQQKDFATLDDHSPNSPEDDYEPSLEVPLPTTLPASQPTSRSNLQTNQSSRLTTSDTTQQGESHNMDRVELSSSSSSRSSGSSEEDQSSNSSRSVSGESASGSSRYSRRSDSESASNSSGSEDESDYEPVITATRPSRSAQPPGPSRPRYPVPGPSNGHPAPSYPRAMPPRFRNQPPHLPPNVRGRPYKVRAPHPAYIPPPQSGLPYPPPVDYYQQQQPPYNIVPPPYLGPPQPYNAAPHPQDIYRQPYYPNGPVPPQPFYPPGPSVPQAHPAHPSPPVPQAPARQSYPPPSRGGAGPRHGPSGRRPPASYRRNPEDVYGQPEYGDDAELSGYY